MRLGVCFLAALLVQIQIVEADDIQVLFENEPLAALPLNLEVNRAKVDLGERLFFDPVLSKDQTISCGSCHKLNEGGANHLRYAQGVDAATGRLNTPTVFNAVFNFTQFWDGRAKNLADQAASPITSKLEMDNDWDTVVQRLSSSSSYQLLFERAFEGGAVSEENITAALAEYQKTLITPNSRFDRFLNRDRDALSSDEEKGYLLFKRYGCTSCHNGRNVGGNMFAKLGVVEEYFSDDRVITSADYGRFNVTGKERHRFFFKVPSLRNVALTAPYLHDGSVQELDDVVRLMARYQLGRRLPNKDVDQIVAFLGALTGEQPQ